MTILIGILCQDGVVVGTDSSTTFTAGQQTTIEQKCKKVEILCDGHVILAGTGGVGLGQRFSAIVENYFADRNNREKEFISIGRELSHRGIHDFHETAAHNPVNFGALLAFVSSRKLKLCEFQFGNFQPEFKTEHLWYVSMGSGQTICDPFLGLQRRVFWRDDKPPSLSNGIFATVWALQHAIDVNPGGIKDPIQVAVLEKGKNGAVARLLEEEELVEHRNNISALEVYIGEYSKPLSGDPDEEVPEVERPALGRTG